MESNMQCVICKKEIDQQGVPAHLLENGDYVHAGVCYDYFNEQAMNESFDQNEVQFLID